MNIRKHIYEEDLDLFFEKIREDNELMMWELEEFIIAVASGKKKILFKEYENMWTLENELDMVQKENNELLDTLQEMRNSPIRITGDTEEDEPDDINDPPF